MTLVPSVDFNEVFFETSLREKGLAEPERKGLHVGNRLTCTPPRALNLVELHAQSEQKLPADIQLQTEEYEFWLLRLGWTLHPASHATIDWAEFGVKLGYFTFIPENTPHDHLLHKFNENIIPPGENIGFPIAYDLYPTSITDEKQVEKTVKFSPSLKFKDASGTEIGGSIGETGCVVKYKQLYPKITSYGNGSAEFYWKFLPGPGNHSVDGGDKELDVIVRKKRNTIVGATIRMKGRGTKLGFITKNETPEATVVYL